ncbi:probable G-protein coupled receptor 139 [Haliotis rufescens]|uniref:probable G-protein coupled receptor 139 n=1 Tax=Haliotis rufescens TaxID=6454 RepID=UPI00201FAC4F|nr:probable G-protein coupled receptor 139 [Haliotis rufescens]
MRMNDSNCSNEENEAILPNEETANLLWTIISPILLLLGTVGNLLSIVVLTRKAMRKSNMSKYLTCLAVADLAVLYVGLLREWVLHGFEKDIRDVHTVACKIHAWLTYSSLHTSAWIQVSMTIERTVFVWRPLRYRILCTKRVATISVGIVISICLILNSHFLIFLEHTKTEPGVYVCDSVETAEYEDFLSKVFPWIDLCVWCIVPVVVHLVCNILIIYRLRTHARTMARHDSTPGADGSRQSLVKSMTTMLLSLNLVYLLCTLPVSVFYALENYWKDSSPGAEAEAQRDLINACVSLLMYLNNSTNFITCFVKGKRFRKEARITFSCQRPRRLPRQRGSTLISTISRSLRSPVTSSSSSSSDIIGLSYRRSAAHPQINNINSSIGM